MAYARIDDQPYVFELDQTVYKVLNSELINRKLFDFAAEDVVGITVVAPGGTLELAKDGEKWQFTTDPFVELSQKKVNEFTEGVAGLRVEMYLEYENADLVAAGLLAAPATVSIKLRNGKRYNLKMEQERPGELPRLAGWLEQKRTFRLRQSDCQKLLRGLDYYIKPDVPEDEPEATAPPGQRLQSVGEMLRPPKP